MKKTLIAFAALSAIAGVAHAQSSVTLYGLVDAYVGQTSTERTTNSANGRGTLAKQKQNVVNSNGQNTSRWGMRGSEDLGGGMKGLFVLEGGLLPDTGASTGISPQGGGMFGRQAWVGLSSGFGTVGLGRQLTAYDDLRGATNNIYDSNFATTAAVWGTGLQDYQARSSNAIKYTSPDFAGFSAAITYGLGENKTGTTDAENVAGIHVKYANGPLVVGFAHQSEKQVVSANNSLFVSLAPATFNSTRKYNLVGASYDFGVAKLSAQYNQAKGNIQNSVAGPVTTVAAKDREANIGVSVPFGAFAIAAGYSRAESEAAGSADRKGTGASLLGTYALSKRTNLYVGALATKVETVNTTGAVTASAAGVTPVVTAQPAAAFNSTLSTKSTQFSVGVKHLF